jgi:hypothetical protein
MLRTACFILAGLLATLSACQDDFGCGGATCPFAEPSHHALVNGVVVDELDRPIAGAFTSVTMSEPGGAGAPTDATGRFTVTVERDKTPTAPDTLRGWVRAAKELAPPPGSTTRPVVRDSVTVLVHLRPSTDPPIASEVLIRLAIGP